MIIYFIVALSSFLSGMGIGGGSVFILLSILFNLLELNEARTYNLLLFISVGIIVSFKNLNQIKSDKKKYLKGIVFIGMGALLGAFISKYVPEKSLKVLFYIFLLLIGIYEIIVSLKNIKLDKNNNKKGVY